jgi:hypothetical protein
MDLSDRGVSSVVDAALFALFVGGAILTLTIPAAPAPETDRADAVADTLGTATADLPYTLAPGAARPCGRGVDFPWTSGPSYRRTAHGTIAEHLATAAVGTATVDGEPVSHTYDDFTAAVRNATRNASRNRHQRVAVRAVWAPYPGAPVHGQVDVGPTPPPSADVHAARLTVDSGMPATRRRALATARNGSYEAVARAVADGVVRGVFPPNATRQALFADYPVNRLVDARYRRFGRLLGTDTSKFVDVAGNRRDVTGANDELRRVLAERLATDMRARFESPRAAARAVRVGDVAVVVRTWSP